MRLRNCAMSGAATGAAFTWDATAGVLRGLIRSTDDAGRSLASTAAALVGALAAAGGVAGFNTR